MTATDYRLNMCLVYAMQAERQRLANIPGMLNPNEQQEEMVDA